MSASASESFCVVPVVFKHFFYFLFVLVSALVFVFVLNRRLTWLSDYHGPGLWPAYNKIQPMFNVNKNQMHECMLIVRCLHAFFCWTHCNFLLFWKPRMLDVICGLKSAKLVDDSWAITTAFSKHVDFVVFGVSWSKIILKKNRHHRCKFVVFIWFPASSAPPIAHCTCSTSNSLRFPLLLVLKFLALTHCIWHTWP